MLAPIYYRLVKRTVSSIPGSWPATSFIRTQRAASMLARGYRSWKRFELYRAAAEKRFVPLGTVSTSSPRVRLSSNRNAHSRIRPAQFRFLRIPKGPIDRSIGRSIPEPQLSCHLASCQQFRTAKEKEKRRRRRKKERRKRRVRDIGYLCRKVD